VVVIDETGSVLLFRIDDPLDTKPAVWITPGGGIEPGETTASAAARELFEETGLLVAPEDLGAPVAATRGDWEFRGLPLYSVDWFFSLRRERFEPSRDGFTDLEHEIQGASRWWHPSELEETDELILPAGLATLARSLVISQHPPPMVELPWLAI
jgi:8-oxo-dGTP pyrophosphatase MutT (NUDIX family)